MRPGRQLARLIAGMIITVIAYAVPSVVQAHPGHVHDGPHDAEVEWALAAVEAPEAEAFALPTNGLQASAMAGAVVEFPGKTVVPTASLRGVGNGAGTCMGNAGGTCCGTMVCCNLGILSGPAPLPTRAFGQVSLIPRDVAGRPGICPEALPRPPRPLT